MIDQLEKERNLLKLQDYSKGTIDTVLVYNKLMGDENAKKICLPETFNDEKILTIIAEKVLFNLEKNVDKVTTENIGKSFQVALLKDLQEIYPCKEEK